jgi:hypothetical protein
MSRQSRDYSHVMCLFFVLNHLDVVKLGYSNDCEVRPQEIHDYCERRYIRILDETSRYYI